VVSSVKKFAWQLKQLLPRPIFLAMRNAGKSIVRVKKKIERQRMQPISKNELMSALRDSGIHAGDVVFVHSALSRIGNVEGGAQTVVDAILEVVTASGTVIMPTFSPVDDYLANLAKGIVIDLRISRSETGKITETFRTTPGVKRSSHPFSSCAAWGKDAEYITKDHATDPRICHKNSPLARVIELQGKVLGLGSAVDAISLFHCAEDIGDIFPIQTHMGPFSGEYVNADGELVRRELFRYDPLVAQYRIDQPYGVWLHERFHEHLFRRGILKAFRFGCAASWTFDANIFWEEIKDLARLGVTIYSRPSEDIIRAMATLPSQGTRSSACSPGTTVEFV
jgi:aminoglycoside N3'-acetyltransferase